MSDSFYWYTTGSGADFDIHDDYLDYTDNIHSTTGVGFNCGDASLVQKNIPSLTKFTVSFTVYACKDDTYSRAAWLWLQLKGYNGSKDIPFISGSDNVLALFPDGNGPIIPYKYGFTKIKVSINSIDDTLLYYVDDNFVGKKENAGIKDYKFTHISMSCTGSGSGYYGRDNAISDVSIYTDDYISLHLDTRRITTNPMKIKMVGILFDGATNYAKIPISLTDIWDWSAEFTFSTTENRSEYDIYHQHCLFGYDTPGYLSRDFHVDVKNGNLYVFNGCGNSKSPFGGTANYDNADVGIDTGIKIQDGELHTIIVKSIENQIDVYCDDVLATTIYTKTTIRNDALYIGCSQIGEKVYGKLSLYGFKLIKHGLNVAEYLPDETQSKNKKLIDNSGNGNDATLYGNDYATEYRYVDAPSKSVDVLFDMSRKIGNTITQSSDTARRLVESLSTQQDTARTLTASAVRYADTSRVLSAMLNVADDTLRAVSRDAVINADTVRVIAENIDVDMAADTARNLYRAEFLLDDTTRKISNLESINADVQRTVTADVIDMLDTVRTLTHTAGLAADTARDVSKSISVNADTARVMNNSTITLHADTSRQLTNGTAVTLDTLRDISLTLSLSVDLSRDTGKTSFDADVTRKLYKIVSVPVDTVRRIPHDLFGTKEPVFENQDTFTPFPQNVTKGAEKGIIDFKLVLEENTLSDKISAGVIGYEYWPGDIIKGTFIDYPYEMKIESTQNTGARQTINAMHYKDRLLYTGMHYDGYHLYELNRNRNASYRYMLRAQWYVNRIKESLSLHVDSRFSNFTPESNFSDTDITYADLLSGLFGWSSQYPWRLVNVFLRGGTLYILQRGRENSVYDITNLPHTEPQIERSIYYSPYASNNKNNTHTSSRIKVPHDPMLDVKDPDEPDEPDDSEYKDPNDNDTDQSVEVRFSGTIMGDHISQTYSNGLCVKEVHTVDAYDEMGNRYEKIDVIVERDYDGGDRCTYEQTNNADGTWRKTDTSYTSDGGVGLGSHSHTEDGDEYGVVQTSDTYTAYLGSGFTCTSTYVDGQFVSSSISGSGISNRTIPYTQNQQNAALKQGAASSDDKDDNNNASRSSGAKTDPYIPTVDHSIRKQIQSEIDAYDRSVQETVSLDIIMPVIAGKPTMTHIIDFTERIKFNGAEYYLVRNTVDQTVSSLKQSIEITRWIRR